jgi:hypothetical protein
MSIINAKEKIKEFIKYACLADPLTYGLMMVEIDNFYRDKMYRVDLVAHLKWAVLESIAKVFSEHPGSIREALKLYDCVVLELYPYLDDIVYREDIDRLIKVINYMIGCLKKNKYYYRAIMEAWESVKEELEEVLSK